MATCNKNDRGRAWTSEETKDLITLWGEEDIQSQLESARHNHKVFERLAEALKDRGHGLRNGRQCCEKIKKLKKKYRDILDHNNRSGRNVKSWEFFSQINNILGSKPTSRPSILLQSMDEENQSQPHSLSQVDDMTMSDDEDSNLLQSFSGSDNGTQAEERSDIEGDGNDFHVSISSTPKRPVLQNKIVKKKKKSKAEKSIDTAIEHFTSTIKEMDAKFLELEYAKQKREQELEEKRIQAEERMRQTEREHEQHMLAMMLQAIQSSSQDTSHNVSNQPQYSTFYNMHQY